VSYEVAEEYVQRLLATPGGGSYKVPPHRRSEVEVLPGTLYRFMLFGGPSGGEVTLSMFLGVGGLGGALWEQEMRTLEMLSGFEHPALPRLLDGGRLDGIEGDAGAAYVRTHREGGPATEEWFAAAAAADRSKVLPHLWHLADALGLLHGANISHRGLWPKALMVQATHSHRGSEIDTVKLARFEMSALLANMFNRREGHASYQQLREAYLADEPLSLLYAPPERLKFILGRPDGELGGPPGDVFSLGMIAAEWLVTGPPTAATTATYDEIRRYQDEVRRRVHVESRDLPGQLIELISTMLDPNASGRPTAYQVAQSFSTSYADAQQLLAVDAPEAPYLVVYMADESDKILLHKWRLIDESAMSEIGKLQLTELIEHDMRGAEILHSPAGAEGFASDDRHKLRRATTVVIGPQVTWFCELFWTPVPGGGTRLFEELLLIKYVRRTEEISHRIGRLRVTGLVRRIPMVEAEPAPMNNPYVAEILSAGRPAWSTLVDRAESARANSPDERDYLESLEWYLQYQRAMLDARTYLFELDYMDGGSDRVHLRWDPAADRTRVTNGQPLSETAILDTSRPDMATFVSNADDGVDRGRVQLALEASPDWSSAETYDVVDVIEPNIVSISTRGKRRPPERGWLRISSDSGTAPQIARQADALIELAGNRTLLRRLIKPQADFRPGDRWALSGGELLGDGREAVRAILSHEGVFALQGPPGTGKTEVTSQAVVDYLTKEAGARVLVAAQSHDALENLALRITRKLGITVPQGSAHTATLDRLALRVRTRGSSYESHPELANLQPAQLAAAVTEYSIRKARHWLASERAQFPALIPVVQDWIQWAPDSQLELNRRVRTAANLVFATTGAATRRNLFVDAAQEPFDWVVIEEAGRAWPTELAIPLVRGVRWTLVGDHAQIGAYSRADVERFLENLGGYDSTEIQAMYKARSRHSENFGAFARFFREPGQGPTKVLSEQYRMDASISSVIGDVFYANTGGLVTKRAQAPHPLTAPGFLLNRRMVWIDTGHTERSVGFWANDYEASICSDLVRSMRPEPGKPGHPSLAIITPYRDQVQALERRLSEHASRISTVDRFQGREADIVVASLVRDRVRPMSSPVSSVGFLAEPARINVMLSRARELLIVVGRLDLFAHSAGPHWHAVTDRFVREGWVVKAENWKEH